VLKVGFALKKIRSSPLGPTRCPVPGKSAKFVRQGILWAGLYLGLVLVPLFVLIVGPAPAGSGFWWDLSAAFGFAGAAMMAVMFILTARFKKVAAPYGVDLVYYFHRQIAMVALLFILAHPLCLLWTDPRLITFVRPSASPYHLDAGIASFVALLVLMITSLWRKPLAIHYDAWRLWHVLLAVSTLVLAIVHIQGVGHYVDAPWERCLWAIIALSCLLVIVHVRILKPLWLLKHPYRVVRVTRERGDAWTVVVAPEGHRGLVFSPGQFAWLTLWDSPFALKEHPFSISSSAMCTEWVSFTIKELGDFTRRVKTLEVNQTAYIDGPYGSFNIDRFVAPGYVFIAGGIGIAPIMGMLRTLDDRQDQRPLLLIYAYNTWERLTFREELAALEQSLALTVVYVLKEPPAGWRGETGLVSQDLLQRHLPQQKDCFEYLICGPTGMIDMTERMLHREQVPLSQIHSELFDLV
jgi:predicted ferric reductase